LRADGQSRVGTWIDAARPRTLPAAVAPVIVGTALAWRDQVMDLAAAGLCLGFALLIQIGTNFANDYYDFMKGADTAARVGPRRAVAAGLVSPATMRVAMWGTFAAAFVVGLGLIAWGGPWLLAIGVASILCGIAYTGGPWPLGYHGLGDVFVFIFFGLVAVGATYFVQAGRLSTDAVLVGVPIGLLAANILVVNNYRDVETDAAAGKRTLAVRFGRRVARVQHALCLVTAFLVPVWFSFQERSAWALVPLILIPLAWRHVQRLRKATLPGELILLLGDTGKFLALYAVLLSAALVLS
jgi:1,4-dihydroxy-2-naphthoate octaprenyltransferase